MGSLDCIERGDKRWGSLTMSMTIFLRDCRCFLVRFWKISQLSSCSSLNPTAKWWFSKTDSSLYISASSESEEKQGNPVLFHQGNFPRDGILVERSDLLVFIRNWFDTPGWSTSWIAAAKMAARISRSVKTAWEKRGRKQEKNTTFRLLRLKSASIIINIRSIRKEVTDQDF